MGKIEYAIAKGELKTRRRFNCNLMHADTNIIFNVIYS